MAMRALDAKGPQRIAISLTGEAAEAVRELAESYGVSAGEVVRRAVAVQRFIQREVDGGSTFLVRKPSGEMDRLQFIFT